MDVTASDNASFLRVRFAARLLSERPESVLDVGTGGGQMLSILRQAGVAVTGVEDDADRVAELVRDGFDVHHAPAHALPFEDGAFDWVAMRHVAHHLEDPAAGIREVWRVARRGLLLAEPWYAVEIPSQRAALEVERWMKARHRASGMVHGENLTAGELLGALDATNQETAATACDVSTLVRLRRRSTQDLIASATPWLATLDEDDPARGEWERILERVATDGLSWNGSLLVAIERSDAASAADPEHA